ncbi:hypothetical protein ISE46_20235 [Pseudomonas aeruginosa]|uniref:hypothetical protein n=1 Tax=Pseudomonas aeruginosa TaxID=287 RepID=UPI001DA629B4|nr:hypothetical protein [Pseudomonas aeruginosa]MBX5907668.1 hypothetical protein [Pseudomonas aeruginosa]WBJ14469.1 hypothetical protein PALA56_01190 [Pseudomonas aeruginosa]
MSHPENIKPVPAVQEAKTAPLTFGGPSGELFHINEGEDVAGALYTVAELGDGLEEICRRIREDLDRCGSAAVCAEFSLIGFVGSMIGALARSAERGIERSKVQQSTAVEARHETD